MIVLWRNKQKPHTDEVVPPGSFLPSFHISSLSLSLSLVFGFKYFPVGGNPQETKLVGSYQATRNLQNYSADGGRRDVFLFQFRHSDKRLV